MAFLDSSRGEYRPKSDPQRFTESEEWQKICDGFSRAVARAKDQPFPAGKAHGQTPFELDIAHNRFLLGGQTIFDGASFHNPAFRETEASRWFLTEFRNAGRRSALLLGNPGSGKTWACLAHANSLAKVNRRGLEIVGSNARFVTAFDLAELFHNSRKKAADEHLEDIKRSKVLIVDDLGAEPAGFRGSDFVAYFDRLFSDRHMHMKTTLITSNASKAQIIDLYGSRFTSRFNDCGLIFESKEGDFRNATTKN